MSSSKPSGISKRGGQWIVIAWIGLARLLGLVLPGTWTQGGPGIVSSDNELSQNLKDANVAETHWSCPTKQSHSQRHEIFGHPPSSCRTRGESGIVRPGTFKLWQVIRK